MNAQHSTRTVTTLAVFASALMFGFSAIATDKSEQLSNVPETSHDEAMIDEVLRDEPLPEYEASVGFDLTWHTIDGGGGTSSGGGFTLTGTIGQHDAGFMSGGDFELVGGFWAGAALSDPTPLCPADLTGSGSVGLADLIALIDQWGPCVNPNDCPADLTGSGSVGLGDLIMLIDQWGPCP